MEEISGPSELTMLNNASVVDVETFMDITDSPGPKSYTLLQGAHLNGTMNVPGGFAQYQYTSPVEEPGCFVKKPCPLEMSIKAANLDTEFENDSYITQPSMALDPSLATFGTLDPNVPAQPLVLCPPKPILMNPQPAPLQVLLVQLQPQSAPPSPKPLIISVTREKRIDGGPNQSTTEAATTINETVANCDENLSDSSIVVESETLPRRKPEEESLIMKFRKVPCKKLSKKKRVKWSDSDEETLADMAKRKWIKCCSRRCYVKVSCKKQDIARNQFRNLEAESKGDLYLASCIKPVDQQNGNKEPPLSPLSNSDDDMLKEIAHESNGNQLLSDEIQNAIKESLKDQKSNKEDSEKTCDWQYSIVVHNRSRIVCFKFLLSVLQIPELRLTALKDRILNGETLESLPVSEIRSKYAKVWEVAKRHLDTVSCTPLPGCKALPPHLTTYPLEPENMLEKFQEFHLGVEGNPVQVSLQSYEKFLTSQKIAYGGNCTVCDSLDYPKQKLKKKTPRGDVFSLMLNHLKTVPYTIPHGCSSPKPHKFFSPSRVTIPMLYEEYRKYFLKETNSELGLRYAIYESLLSRNPTFTIADFDNATNECPKCISLSNDVSPASKTKHSKKQKDRKKKRLKTSNGR